MIQQAGEHRVRTVPLRQHRGKRRQHHRAEVAVDQLAQELLHVFGAELRVGAGELADQLRRVDDPDRVGTEGAQTP